jgi:hypothetical protein
MHRNKEKVDAQMTEQKVATTALLAAAYTEGLAALAVVNKAATTRGK